ncbi:hypothetical protein HYG81_22390 (plasmid) [Natrinema zhouii]|nr:hypothetical protein [Natrinema zhouii]UHQ98716.1 hypothetical protein HYG81_22390 [Natrinema zhouii]
MEDLYHIGSKWLFETLVGKHCLGEFGNRGTESIDFTIALLPGMWVYPRDDRSGKAFEC